MRTAERTLLLVAIGALVAVAAARAVADAHALDIAYLRIEPPATASAPATIELDIDIGAAALLLGVERDAVTEPFLGAHTQELAQASFAKERPASTGGACTLGAPTAVLAPPSIRVTATLACPPGARTWRFSFVTDPRIPPTFQLLVKDVASEQLTVVDRASPVVDLPEPPRAAAPAVAVSRTPVLVGGAIAFAVLSAVAYLVRKRSRRGTA